MVTIEQIDEFRKRTNSSYEDAKYFLQKNDGDVLEAIIDFERTKTGRRHDQDRYRDRYRYNRRDCCAGGRNQDYGQKFSDVLQKGFDTRIVVGDRNSELFSIPVILLLLLLPLWFIVILMFIFLAMLGYKISVQDVKSRNVNVNDFFHNISDKMKESGQGNKAAPQQEPSQPPVPVNTDVPENRDEAKPPEVKKDDQNKEDGFKEYTIE